MILLATTPNALHESKLRICTGGMILILAIDTTEDTSSNNTTNSDD